MYDFAVLLCRYLFIGYILLFLWFAFLYTCAERNKSLFRQQRAAAYQRVTIILLHVTAFMLLSYKRGQYMFDYRILALGVFGLVYFLLVTLAVKKIYAKSCMLLWNCIFFLMDTGLIMLTRLNQNLAIRQLIWFIGGSAVMLFLPSILKLIPRFEKFERLYIIVSIGLIISTLLLGKEEYGSVNWIKFGFLSFQPSEIVKFLFIFYLASVFRKKVDLNQLITTAVLSAIIVVLLVVQRDLGGALIFFMTYLVMLYMATSNHWLFLCGIGSASVASLLAYQLFSHVRVRVSAWLNPWRDISGDGYQIVQSLFAITTWGFLGSGLTRGMPTAIPVVEKDFIFAAICEEFGGLYSLGIILIFLILFYRGFSIAINCQRRYYSLLSAGVSSMMAFQTFLILGGVTKFIPLTGVTLPFISYGGSSVIVSLLMAGLLQWVNVYSEKRARQEGEE
ncbi:MAG: FtsW/RodA/SpoVE family cell cycle protein [Clostridiales bacterium]|nr:FtsW/RodA/SpoVE family cell cycle protein [Clostridiales bacterium]